MEIEDDVAYALEEMAKDIRGMKDEELQETLFFIQKLRLDIEQGRYDTEDKKWSELNWRKEIDMEELDEINKDIETLEEKEVKEEVLEEEAKQVEKKETEDDLKYIEISLGSDNLFKDIAIKEIGKERLINYLKES